jgi:hypothetical protein
MVRRFVCFIDVLKKDDVLNLFQSAGFIVAVAIFPYFGTSLFIQLLQNYVCKYLVEIKHVLRYAAISVRIVYYLFIGIGIGRRNCGKFSPNYCNGHLEVFNFLFVDLAFIIPYYKKVIKSQNKTWKQRFKKKYSAVLLIRMKWDGLLKTYMIMLVPLWLLTGGCYTK